MNLIVRIPDEHAARVTAVDATQLQRVALEAALRATDSAGRDPRAVAGIASDLSPQQAATGMRAARTGNRLPPGVTIRDLMTDGRA